MRTIGLIAFVVLVSLRAEAADWFAGNELTPQAVAALQTMAVAEDFGLEAGDYALSIDADVHRDILAGRGNDTRRRQFEAALESSLGRFLQHLSSGRVAPSSAGFQLGAELPAIDVDAAIARIAQATNVRETIEQYEPRALPYRRLRQVLPRYRQLTQRASLTALPPISRSLRAGDQYEGIAQLQALLRATGDLESEVTPADNLVLDDITVDALKRFQARHGLEVDGVLGRKTFTALTTPLAARVRQIELTLERWRWTSRLSRPDIVVNVPQFMLFALPRPGEAPQDVLEMRVIVGQDQPHTRTPVFTADMRYVVFHPFWDVPQSIVRRELLPQMRRRPDYLERHHMEIVRGAGDNAAVVEATAEALAALEAGQLRLRQRPGPDNSLGPIKFILPNPHNVYLHGTPAVELFARSQRGFSHGCIRVEDPTALAAYVLASAAEPWDDERIEQAFCEGKTRRVDLATPLRVMIFYGTAVATDSHGVMFFEDIYGYDARLQRLLTARQRDTIR